MTNIVLTIFILLRIFVDNLVDDVNNIVKKDIYPLFLCG